MPASAGRVRMPHNNRVPAGRALVTSDIWSKTIGHDPYAATEDDGVTETEAALHAEKTKTLLQLAKHQNLGVNTRTAKDGTDDFARKMFLGLKEGKKRRRADVSLVGEEGVDDQRNVTDAMKRCLEAESSSSEDEYVEEEDLAAERVDVNGRKLDKETSGVMEKGSMEKKIRKKKARKNRRSKDDSSSSSEDSSRHRHRRRKRRKRKKDDRERRKRHERKRRRERSRADDSSGSSGSDVENKDKQQPRVRKSDKTRHKKASSHSKREKGFIDDRKMKSADANNSVAS